MLELLQAQQPDSDAPVFQKTVIERTASLFRETNEWFVAC